MVVMAITRVGKLNLNNSRGLPGYVLLFFDKRSGFREPRFDSVKFARFLISRSQSGRLQVPRLDHSVGCRVRKTSRFVRGYGFTEKRG